MSVDVGPPEGSFPDETKQKQGYDNIILLKTHKYNRYSGNLFVFQVSGRQKYHWLNWFVRRVCYFRFLWSSRSECSSHARLYHPQIKAVCIGRVKSLRVAFLLAPSMLHHSWQALADGRCKLHTAERLVEVFGVRLTDNPNIRSVHPWSRLVLEERCYYVVWAQTRRSSLIFHNSRRSWVRSLLSVASVISFLLMWSREPLDSFSGSALVCNTTSLQADFQSCTDASGCLKEGNQSRLDQQEWKLWFVVNWESRCPLKKWRLSDDVTSKSQKRTRHCSFQHSESEDYTVYSLYFDNFTKCTFCSLVL